MLISRAPKKSKPATPATPATPALPPMAAPYPYPLHLHTPPGPQYQQTKQLHYCDFDDMPSSDPIEELAPDMTYPELPEWLEDLDRGP